MAKSETGRRSSYAASEELNTVLKDLQSILKLFRKKDGSLDPEVKLKDSFSSLGKPPFQQKKLTEYIHQKHAKFWTERGVSEVALTAKVQRALGKLRKEEPAIRQIFNFKQPFRKVGSPSPSRISQAKTNRKIEERLNELELFQRRFESLLQTGNPEPEAPLGDEAEKESYS